MLSARCDVSPFFRAFVFDIFLFRKTAWFWCFYGLFYAGFRWVLGLFISVLVLRFPSFLGRSVYDKTVVVFCLHWFVRV
jgi:hypothetical protein